MDNYEAVYNAVRGKIHWPDVEQIMRSTFDISWPLEHIKQEFMNAAFELQRPCVIFKPKLYPDGDMWCALFGDDLQSGVAAFGETPSAAMYAFDKEWRERKLLGKPKCDICGDHHEGEIPRSCQTGDGT